MDRNFGSFVAIIEAFGGPSKFSDAIGIESFHGQSMKNRDSIPPGYWLRTENAAKRLSIKNISVRSMAELAEKRANAA